MLVSVAVIGFPDGAEIINLTAAIMMATAMLPYGLRLMASIRAPVALSR